MNHHLALFALLAACTPASTNDIDTAETDTDVKETDIVETDVQLATFNTPESALWNASDNSYFVTNIAGESDAADGIGWIAKVDAIGQPVEPRWVDGLHAPKGMALVGNHLYVADLHELLDIDASTGEILQHITVTGALFLNDVTASADTVWVSDTFGGAVFAYTPATQATIELVRDPALASLNGLAFDGTRILGGTTGDFMDPTDLGDLVSISTSGELTVLTEDAGKIDGLVFDGTRFLGTDFRGLLLSIEPDGTTTVLTDLATDRGMTSAADLGYDPVGQRVAIPDLFASNLVLIDLSGQ
jgi:hypothetical protein